MEDTRERMIAHMPQEAQEVMRMLFEQIDDADRSLGLAPPVQAAGTAIDQVWKRRPPRDGYEYSERMREREAAIAPIMKMITHWLTVFPQPMQFVMPADQLPSFLSAPSPSTP